ncbi:MAG: 1,4-alpha-glucan branching protein GlgB [Hydrogenophaga sp.]|uniref:1,4-alpha-glucan branching protein GlgB n=1 Tax=Hydrogenophaga sp. TaxID=1904254 RepID=UPI002730A92E|nr:1,4-alpha-glucan branching protein GlgB [Hydrogenophaga sp.]MDP2164451.1 1,4-alpha-glucan branching protein GlgB [Hydrogenophaga sp.]MDP3475110.1 1,4-alpha-glucan branching protein GlgB [Hydrogenophaga sp.]
MKKSPSANLPPEPSLPANAPQGFWIGETDAWLLAEGKHLRPWQKMGAHPTVMDGAAGTAFAVWAPHARSVGLIGDFNNWQAQPMRLRPECGVWELFVSGAGVGDWYKFDVQGADGRLVMKTDPYARHTELPPGNAARVCEPLRKFAAPPGPHQRPAAPMAIYEVHAGSWKRPDGPHTLPTWDDLAAHLVPYAAGLGFTHLELLPVSEHPFYASWGYQPTGLYAPTARHGSPEAFRRFVDAAHAAGLKVILDWVPAHFPSDEHALARFDGTALYEHADPREGFHRDWNTLIYNFGRHEVRNFLVGNALFWVEQFGIDGLRVDAVASMLYRDYSRPPGEWVPNRDGGRENYEAIAFLREVHEVLQREAPQATTIAEESTAFPRVTGPVAEGGLGFDHKWNMGWMHDTLAYFAIDPVHRRWHHNKLTFAMMYAYSEDYCLPLSHDEVVHGKGSLLGKMAGDRWQQLANLRALYAWMYAHPGKKLLFMGAELAQPAEWDHDSELSWHLLDDPAHAGVQRLVCDLNHRYRVQPALYARDTDHHSFQWLVVDDADHSVLAFARYGHRLEDTVVLIANLTPMVRHGYRVGLPHGAGWHETLNTDSAHYGGSNVGNHGRVLADDLPLHGQRWSAALTLPPLAVLWLQPEKS